MPRSRSSCVCGPIMYPQAHEASRAFAGLPLAEGARPAAAVATRRMRLRRCSGPLLSAISRYRRQRRWWPLADTLVPQRPHLCCEQSTKPRRLSRFRLLPGTREVRHHVQWEAAIALRCLLPGLPQALRLTIQSCATRSRSLPASRLTAAAFPLRTQLAKSDGAKRSCACLL
jgi:hypothetical protein